MLELYQVDTKNGISFDELEELAKDETVYCMYIMDSGYAEAYGFKGGPRIRSLQETYNSYDSMKRNILRDRIVNGETLLVWFFKNEN